MVAPAQTQEQEQQLPPHQRSMQQRHLLEQAAVQGAVWLRKILELERHSQDELASALTDSPLKPYWIAQAQAIIVYSYSKTAMLLGHASGHGFLVARLPTSHPALIKFSAPLFVKVRFTSLGLSMGRTSTCSFVACMGKQLQQELLSCGARRLRGLDAALVCGSMLHDRPDVLTSNCVGGMAGTVGVSSVHGGMLDLSFAGGAISVDAAKNAAAYGDVKPSQIVDGSIEPPPELQPLYAELSLIVHQADAERPSAAPSRVSASLERFCAGTDPDRALVLQDGTLHQEGRGPAALARHSN